MYISKVTPKRTKYSELLCKSKCTFMIWRADRIEWIQIHPQIKSIYLGNKRRGDPMKWIDCEEL